MRAGMFRPMANVSVAKSTWEAAVRGGCGLAANHNNKGWHGHLEQALAKEDLNDLLDEGKQAAVVNADALLQQRQHVLNLPQKTATETGRHRHRLFGRPGPDRCLVTARRPAWGKVLSSSLRMSMALWKIMSTCSFSSAAGGPARAPRELRCTPAELAQAASAWAYRRYNPTWRARLRRPRTRVC